MPDPSDTPSEATADAEVPLRARGWGIPILLALVCIVAVTACDAVMGTIHGPVPEQPPPLQPANVEPALATAVSVTDVPLG